MAVVRRTSPDVESVALHDRAAAEAYVASVCFKHGPPSLLGAELEWTVHYARDPCRRLDARDLTAALGDHAPPTLNPDSPHLPLPGGALVTVEPGGQVEISSSPASSLADLITTVSADMAVLSESLAVAGLRLGTSGLDPYRPPHRLLDTPRYAAMEAAFAPIGPDGMIMMCSSAGLQVCVDAGEPHQIAARWAALHALGPVLSALFANSAQTRDGTTHWASARMRALLGTDPPRMRPAAVTADPAASWARRAVDVPLVCVRRADGRWTPPGRISFADWIAGALPGPPTTDDLDYHLSTLFPPVRPRGYLEVRYLDTQPGGQWVAPVALLAASLATESRVDTVLDIAGPAEGRWLSAARYGLADPRLAQTAKAVVDLAGGALVADAGIDPGLAASIVERTAERIWREVDRS